MADKGKQFCERHYVLEDSQRKSSEQRDFHMITSITHYILPRWHNFSSRSRSAEEIPSKSSNAFLVEPRRNCRRWPIW